MGQILGVQTPTTSVVKSNKSIFILLGVFVIVAAVTGYLLVLKGVIKSPLAPKAPTTVELKKEYKNPFAKDTQFVNPFKPNKNPFRAL